MHISEKGISLIKRYEGLGDGDRELPGLQPYKDSGGVWTIGYGHTGPVVRDGLILQLVETDEERETYLTLSIEEAETLLKTDLIKYENHVKGIVKKPVTQEMFDALVSFTYNLGRGGLKMLVTTRLNLGRYTATADAMLLYNKDNGKVLRGLERRRKEERELFLSTFKLPTED